MLEYLARCTRGVAIANGRITAFNDGMVTLNIKNRYNVRPEALTITAVAFARQPLLHSLPGRLARIRHCVFMANRNRSVKLAAIAIDTTKRLTPQTFAIGNWIFRNSLPFEFSAS